MKKIFIALALSIFCLWSNAQVFPRPPNASPGIPYSPIIGAINLAIPSSGSFANNGALTGLTALPAAISGYFYFGANVICSSGQAAGMYWSVMSGVSAATVYNNTYTTGLPAAPTTLIPFSCTGPGAYTQLTNSYVTALSYSLPGGSLGNNGQFDARFTINTNATANAKLIDFRFGGASAGAAASGTQFFSHSFSNSAVTFFTYTNVGVANQGSQSANTNTGSFNGAGGGSATTNPTVGAVNTAATTNATIDLQLSTASDYIVISTYKYTINPN